MTAKMPRSFSPSSWKLWQQCPRQWKRRYVDFDKRPPTVELVVGRFVHSVLAELFEAEPTERTKAKAREIAAAQWKAMQRDAEFRTLALDEEGAAAFKAEVWQLVLGEWELEDPGAVKVVATERKVRVAVEGVPFTGALDRLDETRAGLAVRDYKTGKPPNFDHRQKDAPQVLLYAAASEAAGLGEGKPVVEASLLYLAGPAWVDAPVGIAKRRSVVREYAMDWADVQEACKAESFPPKPSTLCGWCDYVAECPEGAAAVRERYGNGQRDVPALALLEEKPC